MKFNFKGIRFNTWLYFFGFSALMLTVLGLLLSLIIKPYYRDNQINTIDSLSETFEKSLLSKKINASELEDINSIVIGNNVCALIYNENGNGLYDSDSLGEMCMLNKEVNIDNETYNIEKDPKKIIKYLKENKNINETLSSSGGYEMLLYAKQVKANLSNYYLFINTPLEPVESLVDYILSQYFYVAAFLFIVSLAVSFILAQKITSPIVHMTKEANKLKDGNYDVSFGVNNQYSEITDLATTLDDATDKLSKVDELRKDLVANVSHDLKTPLTVIQSYAEMIRDISGDNPIKREEHINVILQETKYLSKLITDMQEYSKMQAGFITLNKINFDLQECIMEVIDLLNKLLEEKHIKLKTNIFSMIVYADELKISQVVYNFLSNAIKHSKDSSIIEINFVEKEKTIRVEVVDYGDGIDSELLPYIWDRYYKIDKGFARNQNSTGLGLAIAKAILEAHDYKYGVESKLNEGSTFYFEVEKDIDDEF